MAVFKYIGLPDSTPLADGKYEVRYPKSLSDPSLVRVQIAKGETFEVPDDQEFSILCLTGLCAPGNPQLKILERVS